MVDIHTSETRSYNMSRIKSKDTKPEEMVRKYLFSQGFRYRKNDKRLVGKPDLVLPKYKTVVFINGCFWHMHRDCKYFSWPKNNADFWKQKINKNVSRDLKTYAQLKDSGWNVLVIWECEIKKEKRNETLLKLVKDIRKMQNQ